MHTSIRIVYLLSLLSVWASGDLLAQGTISAANSSFVRPSISSFDTTPEADFLGVGTGDYVFEAGWWFRINGATQETAFPLPSTQEYTGGVSTLTWDNPSGTGAFSATEESGMVTLQPGTATVSMTMWITNHSAVDPLTIDLFHFIDLDVDGSGGGDTVTQPIPGLPILRIEDANDGFAEYAGHRATAFMVRPFADLTDVAGLLSDDQVTHFDNSGLSSTEINGTAGMQWSLTIPPNNIRFVQLAFSGNEVVAPHRDIFDSGFEY